MAKEPQSNITDHDLCVICDAPAEHNHHTLSGSDRKRADKYGLIVPLCGDCHNLSKGGRPLGWRCDVHGCPKIERLMKIIGQLTREQQIMEEIGCDRKTARMRFMTEFMESFI